MKNLVINASRLLRLAFLLGIGAVTLRTWVENPNVYPFPMPLPSG